MDLTSFTNLVKYALWNIEDKKPDEVNQEVFDEMKVHGIAALCASILDTLDMQPSLYNQWERLIIMQVAAYLRYIRMQSYLPITVPYVILKGTSAAQYYPHQEYRLMGDIDIITKREDFDKAVAELVDNGFCIAKELERECGLVKKGVMVEIHRYYASLNDPNQARYLDDLIIANINPSHVLPDLINGLTLLEHISQHLEHGLGLRQIIDWMMFVDKCLPDDKWKDFCPMTEKIGLKNLALVTTRMCELYMGLPTRKWSEEADVVLCKQLMDYVMSCGNFGNKWDQESRVSTDVFTYWHTPKNAFKMLQKRGRINWRASHNWIVLRHFAWFYQLCRYIWKGLRQKKAFSRLVNDYKTARERNHLFDKLGVKQTPKGLAVFKEGQYIKK